jgi:hypothetical protein
MSVRTPSISPANLGGVRQGLSAGLYLGFEEEFCIMHPLQTLRMSSEWKYSGLL